MKKLYKYCIDDVYRIPESDGIYEYKIRGWIWPNDFKTQIISQNKDVETKIEIRTEKRIDLYNAGITENKDDAQGFVISFKAPKGKYSLNLNTPDDKRICTINVNKESIIRKTKFRIYFLWKIITNLRPSLFRKIKLYKRIYGTQNLKNYIAQIVKAEEPNVQATYADWLRIARPQKNELKKQRKTQFEYSPVVSIIVPTYNTPIEYLREMIDTVIAQTYHKWQLCIADGSGNNEELAAVLKEYAEKDKRIVYRLLDKNMGISGNTNAALELATGELVALYDHDDTLEPNALYEIILKFQESEVDVVYTDEDKIVGPDWENVDPNFKPDYNLSFLRACNYITHFFCVKTRIIKEIGGFRTEYDGSQDYDVILRCCEKARKVRHADKILYHWRVHSNSTAANPENKMYCYESGRKAIQNHYDRNDIKATVSLSNLYGGYVTEFDIREDVKLSILVMGTQFNNINRCINYLKQNGCQDIEIRGLQKTKNINLINKAISECEGNYILLLDSALSMVNEKSIKEMIGMCIQADVGAVGSKILYKNNTVFHAGIIMDSYGNYNYVFKDIKDRDYGYQARAFFPSDYDAVSGKCIMFSKKAFESVGGFLDIYSFEYSVIDFCRRLRKDGLRVVFNPNSKWILKTSKRIKTDMDKKDENALGKNEMLSCDVYNYNKNMSFEVPYTIKMF